MINSSGFSNLNSFESIDEIVEKDSEELASILNLVGLTGGQFSSTQAKSISFTLYPENYEEAYEKKISSLEKVVEFDSMPEVRLFLRRNSYLTDVIYEAIRKVKQIFQEEKLKLTIENDPETETDSMVLSLRILTKKDPRETIELLSKFNEEWWLEAKPRTNQKLIIEEEYV